MNKVYKSVWNESIGTWVAVSETARSSGKGGTKAAKVALAATMAFGSQAFAGVSLGNVDDSGSASDMAIGDHAYGVSSRCPTITTYGWASAIGYGSAAQGCAATAIGAGSSAGSTANNTLEIYATAIGSGATASQLNTVALGAFALAVAPNSVVVGARSSIDPSANNTTVVGSGSTVASGSGNSVIVGNTARIGTSASASVALGTGAAVNNNASNSVALGAGSVADRANVVAMGTSTSTRALSYISAGTQASDATNVSQLTPVVSALGGNTKLNADGTVTGPTYTLKGTAYNNVGDALTALGDSSGKYFHVNSTEADSSATGTSATAIGAQSVASGLNTTAIGYQAVSSGPNESIAIGSQVQSTANDAISIGSQIVNAGKSSIAIGSNAVALDEASTSSVLLAPDTGAVTNSANSFSFNPYGGTGTSDSSDAVNLSGTAAGASGGVTIGSKSSVTAANAVAMGASAVASATDALALGHNAQAAFSNSVALGANSLTDRANTVSVGSSSLRRSIANVAAGIQDYDAVNVTQLQNVTTLLGAGAKVNPDGTIQAPAYTVAGVSSANVGGAISTIDTELSNKVAYDKSSKTHVTLGGVGASTPVTMSNVAAGALSSNSTDAVNGSQLNSTNQNVSALQTFATNINNGGGIKFFHSNSQLADSSATGADAVAIGGAAVASANNSVAIGASSIASRANTISVGAAGNERQITNVAAGTTLTDAVNVSQLGALSDLAVKYDTNPDGSVNYRNVTLGGVGASGTTRLTNLSAANLTSSSTDAVNGAQLFGTDQRVGSLETFETDINNGGGIKYFHTKSTLADSSATGSDSVAVGGAAVASANSAVALGSNSVADRINTVSVGAAGKERQITNVAAGTQVTDAVNLGQLTAVSNNVDTLGSFAVKYDTATDGKPNYQSVTLGGAGANQPTKLTNLATANLNSTSTDAVNGSQLYSTNQRVGSLETFETNINNGGGIKYFHTNSTLADSSAMGTDSVAIGGAAAASANNSVALGSNSVADRANTVSVGSSGKERQITNVAAGTASTDAVNLGQLTSVSNNLDTLDSFAVKYDTKTDGTPNYEQITLGGSSATKPTLLTNVAAGKLSDDSTDAVNGSQLYATNQNVGSLQDFTNNVNNGGGIKYFHSNSKLADSSATGADSVAIGGAAVSSAKNSVALGANSVADRDNAVSVGAAGSERQITNVAAGTAATDAVNVSQLNSVSNSVSTLSAAAIKYDTNADGTPDYTSATLGNGTTAGTALHNVAAGSGDMDAVNLGQLNDMIGQVANLANGAYNPMFSADGSRDTEAATSSGTHSVASGANAVASGVNAVASGASSVASGANAVALGTSASATGANALASGASSVASGINAVAMGNSASASANQGVAVGANASATASNAVALGSGSVADRDNSVSVGSQGSERQITNVAPGVNGTDAVNMTQLQGVQQSVNNISRTAYSGIAMAGALAGLPQVEAGKTFQLSAGAGAYANYAALAVGASARLTQNTIVKLGASATNGSHVLVNAGLGYSW